MLLWFVSLALTVISSYSFPQSNFVFADLEVENDGTIWILQNSGSEIVRLTDDGRSEVFDISYSGIPDGLTITSTGRFAVSFRSPFSVRVYNSEDRLLEEFDTETIGDIVFSGFTILGTDVFQNEVISLPEKERIWRNCVSNDSRLSYAPNGSTLIDGSRGVFLLRFGEVAERLAEKGSACFSKDGILVLSDGVLLNSSSDLDTLLSDLPHSFLSSSPDGKIVVLWGSSSPLILE